MSLSQLLSVKILQSFMTATFFLEYKPVGVENFSQIEFEYFLMIRFRLFIFCHRGTGSRCFPLGFFSGNVNFHCLG